MTLPETIETTPAGVPASRDGAPPPAAPRLRRQGTGSAARARRGWRLLRPLDRYVLGEFARIFAVTAVGFPLLIILIDLTDNLDDYLERRLPIARIALSYVYWMPESMFMVLPAAVLFATVFAVGGFTRANEVTAAKASGMSFYRLIAPIFVGSFVAAGLGLVLGEVAAVTSARRTELIGENREHTTARANFVHATGDGWVYKVGFLDAFTGTMDRVEVERRGTGPAYPTIVVTAAAAEWQADRGGWRLDRGAVHVLPDTTTAHVVQFDSLRSRHFDDTPADVTQIPREPQDLGYEELGAYIAALELAGVDANELRVERALKIAIPVTCIIIVLFGAPLATSTQRGGAAYGVGISLATTVLFLILIQLTKAIGGTAQPLLRPELAAWLPSAIFGVVGATLLARVRT